MLVPKQFMYLRHGETDWNRENRCVGQADRPLTERGKAQAEVARHYFESLNIGMIFHSPLARAVETAKIVARGMRASIHRVSTGQPFTSNSMHKC